MSLPQCSADELLDLSLKQILEEDDCALTQKDSEGSQPSSPCLFFDFDSSLLEDDSFCLSKPLRKGTAPDLLREEALPRERYIALAQEQVGSRQLQQLLAEGPAASRQAIAEELLRHSELVICDPFGNYVFQKMLEHCPGVLGRAVAAILPRFRSYALHVYGCRVLQSLLDSLQGDEAVLRLFAEVRDCLPYLSLDSQGNHVVQKFIEVLGDELPADSLEALTREFEQLAFNAFGCRVIQKVLRHNSEERVAAMVLKVLQLAYPLSLCQYGNYIVSNVLRLGEQVRGYVSQLVLDRALELASDKYASNVVEKCLELHPAFSHELVERLDQPFDLGRDKGMNGVLYLAKSRFGNYVVKTLLRISTGAHRRALLQVLKKNERNLEGHSCGSHVIKELNKLEHY